MRQNIVLNMRLRNLPRISEMQFSRNKSYVTSFVKIGNSLTKICFIYFFFILC